MTRPTPTAATSAPLRRVRIHGAPSGAPSGAPWRAPLLALLLATQAAAQVIPTGTPAVDILLSQAITEHRTFLTCSALDPGLHAQITENWQRDITAAAAILQTNKVPPEAIAAFTAAAAPAALMPADDTPWGQVQGLCATRPDWQASYFQLSLTVLETSLPGAFK